MVFDPQLVARYDTRGPRYTSYPTAIHFHDRFGAEDYAEALATSNEAPIPRDLSLYLHLPFCREACWYCGCHRSITHRADRTRAYRETLLDEIALLGERVDRDRLVRQLHLGGGTPTHYRPDELAGLLNGLARAFSFAPARECEMGIEIDPRSVTPESARELVALGFDRISFGIQDFDPRVQAAINRRQSISQVQALVDAVRGAGAQSVSFDLIYGLPRQTPESFSRTLRAVGAMQPDRVSVYAYAHMPERFPLQSLMPVEALPSAAVRLRLLELCHRYFEASGYRALGLDHFVRPGDPLMTALEDGSVQRNFQGYSTHSECDLVGLGASAISSIGDVYVQNASAIRAWTGAVQEGRLPVARGLQLNAEDRLRRDVIQSLMCHGYVDTLPLEVTHHCDFWRFFADAVPALRAMADDGLLEMDAQCVRLTERGRLLTRNVAMVFDAYATAGDEGRYSRVI